MSRRRARRVPGKEGGLLVGRPALTQSDVEGFEAGGVVDDELEDVEEEGDDEDEEDDVSAVDVVLDFSPDELSFLSPPVFSEATAFLRASDG